jgi:hypothetical protein
VLAPATLAALPSTRAISQTRVFITLTLSLPLSRPLGFAHLRRGFPARSVRSIRFSLDLGYELSGRSQPKPGVLRLERCARRERFAIVWSGWDSKPPRNSFRFCRAKLVIDWLFLEPAPNESKFSRYICTKLIALDRTQEKRNGVASKLREPSRAGS